MIFFFKTPQKSVIATEANHPLNEQEVKELSWLYGDAELLKDETLTGYYVGPRREMVTPWSTNAVEITQNMGLSGIQRIEEYFPVQSEEAEHDPMLQRMYNGLNQDIFTINIKPEPIKYVDNLEEYNEQEGLALSPEEIEYLHKIEKENGRPLTDSEIFGFAQINSEHCRHKIFGGTFIDAGEPQQDTVSLQRQRSLCARSCRRAVCARRPVNERLLPRERHRECHLAEGRDPQLPHHRRAFQRRCYRYGW